MMIQNHLQPCVVISGKVSKICLSAIQSKREEFLLHAWDQSHVDEYMWL